MTSVCNRAMGNEGWPKYSLPHLRKKVSYGNVNFHVVVKSILLWQAITTDDG